MIGGRPFYKVLDTTVQLAPTQEQDFGPYNYGPGQTIRVHSSSRANHYLGVFNAPDYLRFRARGGRAPFLLGSARTGHLLDFNTTGQGQVYVVLRLSGWNFAGSWPVAVSMEIA